MVYERSSGSLALHWFYVVIETQIQHMSHGWLEDIWNCTDAINKCILLGLCPVVVDMVVQCHREHFVVSFGLWSSGWHVHDDGWNYERGVGLLGRDKGGYVLAKWRRRCEVLCRNTVCAYRMHYYSWGLEASYPNLVDSKSSIFSSFGPITDSNAITPLARVIAADVDIQKQVLENKCMGSTQKRAYSWAHVSTVKWSWAWVLGRIC